MAAGTSARQSTVLLFLFYAAQLPCGTIASLAPAAVLVLDRWKLCVVLEAIQWLCDVAAAWGDGCCDAEECDDVVVVVADDGVSTIEAVVYWVFGGDDVPLQASDGVVLVTVVG